MVRPLLSGRVKRRDRGGQARHELEIEASCGRQTVEQRLLREAVHLHDPVHGRTCAAERKRSVALPRNRDDSAIKRRRCAPVQPNFRIAKGVAAIQRRKVEIVEANGALQLVCAIAGQKYDRCVCVNSLDPGAAVRRRRGEEIRDGCLVLGDHTRRGSNCSARQHASRRTSRHVGRPAIAEYFAIGFENSADIATRRSGAGGYLHVCCRQDSCVAFSVGFDGSDSSYFKTMAFYREVIYGEILKTTQTECRGASPRVESSPKSLAHLRNP